MIYIVKINNSEYEVEVEKGKASIVRTITIDAQESSKKEISATKDAENPVKSTSGGKGDVVKAPLPGTITDVKVREGSKVKSGDILLILEAMKMENEVLAPKDGTVSGIFVRKGDTVATNDQLIVIE